MRISGTSASELARQIRHGEVSPVEVVRAHIDRIVECNERTNAFVTLCKEEAIERARMAERELESGEEVGPLHGVPIGIKDLQPVAGVRCTYGSKLYADNIPDSDSQLVRSLKDSGAIVLGKTNAPEFALEGTTDNYLFGPTSTPFDEHRNAGGSSGGSAAAVGDGLVPIAQGSDGGGSIRIPASFCGVYGYKASFGRIPAASPPNQFGRHTPFLHVGPLTRYVEDAALFLDILSQPSTNDPFALPNTETDFRSATHQPVSGFDIAYSPDLGLYEIDRRVSDVVDDAVYEFETAGATVSEVELEFRHSRDEIVEVFNTMFDVYFAYQAAYEIDSLPEHMDAVTPEIARSIRNGNNVSAVEYRGTEHIRTEVFNTIQQVFEDYDLLVSPTLAVPPFRNDDPEVYRDDVLVGPTEINGQSVHRRDGWTLCIPFNMSGHPAASIPAGFTDDGLPIGMQLVGDRHDDRSVLAASGAFERNKPWHDRYDR